MKRLIHILFLVLAISAFAEDAPLILAHLVGQNNGSVDKEIVVTAEKQKAFHFHSEFKGGGTWYDVFISMENGNLTVLERDSISSSYKSGSKVGTSENIYRLPVDKIDDYLIELKHANRITLKTITKDSSTSR